MCKNVKGWLVGCGSQAVPTAQISNCSPLRNRMIFWIVIFGFICSCEIVLAGNGNTPEEFADDRLAPNNLQPNDLGKNSRDDYKDQHPEEEDKPWIDEYYLRGERDVMHDDPNRAYTAEKAARYQRPTIGYLNSDRHQGPSQDADPDTGTPPSDDEEVIGGGVYKKTIPTKRVEGEDVPDDEKIVENVWRFAEDLLWPKDWRGPGPLSTRSDTWKFDEFEKGHLDIGKGIPGKGFYCIENAYFLASLLRELGYKVQYKNTVPSTARDRWGMQTAGINVWYGGKWHFYDPWESIKNEDDYVNGTGNASVPYHDYKMYRRTKPLTSEDNWNTNGDKPEDMDGWEFHKENLGNDGAGARGGGKSRMRLHDEQEQKTGWPGADADSWNSSSPRLREIPGSGYFDPTSLIAARMGIEEDPNWTPLGEEILFWTFDNMELIVTSYTLEVINPTEVTIHYSIDLEIQEVNRVIYMVKPTTTTLEGTLNASESINIPLIFLVSAPEPTPPEPIQGLRINVVDEMVYLTWDPSEGADYYTVYRVEGIEVPQSTVGEEPIGYSISAYFEEPCPNYGTYFYMVTASSEGGESELHPNEGSVEALQILEQTPITTLSE